MSELPNGWGEAALLELAGYSGLMDDGDWIESKDQDPQGDVRLIQLADIGDGHFVDKSRRFLTSERAAALRCTYLQPGDLLIARMPDPLGRACIFPYIGMPAVTAVDVCIWRSIKDGADARWLMHFVNSPEIRNQIQSQASGTTRQRVSGGNLKRLPVPVPPAPEQRRIVAKLDSLRARSSRARQELDHIPKLIERYKQAILAKAFSGELINQRAHGTNLPHDNCWDLPTTWRWVRFDDAAEIASNLVPTSEVQQLPHIAPDNIGAGTGKLLPFRTVAEDGVKSPKHRFYPGQVLYSKIRPYLRKAVLIDFDGVCSADMYPLNARKGVNPRYLHYWAFSQQLASFVIDHEGRTVLPKVNQVGLNQTPFPLPPESDQEAIVSLLDRAFAWLDKIATEHSRAELLLPKLDQAILAKAFRGELVPQDPNDEPASVLLERIKAEERPAVPHKSRRVRSA